VAGSCRSTEPPTRRVAADIQLNGLEVQVVIDGAGPPLLLLHGFTGSVRVWDDLRRELADTATVIALDLIGHGASAVPPEVERYTLEWCARDLAVLLDILHLERVDLLGYSMGGRAALQFAVRHPERVQTLVLESASAGIESDVERLRRRQSDDALAERILGIGIAAFVEEWERQPLLALAAHVPEEVRARQHALRLQHKPLGLANSLRGMGAGRQTPLWSSLGQLTLPVQLIVGATDARYGVIAERMCSALPHATLHVVADAGHTVHLDQPRQFVALIRHW
jgi:2-succinyl-6-hydroxy-2,4-cyclohexadiene-1-carboxylate synthase